MQRSRAFYEGVLRLEPIYANDRSSAYAVAGRDACGLDFHRQYERKPARCQRITVSGLTIAKALSTPGAKPYSQAKNARSTFVKVARFGDLRRRTLICCRSARFSASSEARDRNRPTSAYQINLQILDIG